MNRKLLVWRFGFIVSVGAAFGLLWWRSHVDDFESIRTPDQAAAWAKAAQAEATGDIVVAIGSLDHPNVNNRDPAFPDSLAKYLLSVREANLTFVQRKLAEKPEPPAADWALEGSYDTFPARKVRVHLNMVRIRGGSKATNVDGVFGQDLHEQIARAVKDIVRTPEPSLARYSGKMTEAQIHLERGRELSGFDAPYKLLTRINVYEADISNQDEVARQKFRLEQAIASLESSLVLETNRAETKVLLGACYETAFINRRADARKLYQEVIDRSSDETWRHNAKARLVLSWEVEDRDQAVELMNRFEKEAASPDRAKWFRTHGDVYRARSPEYDFSDRKKAVVAALDRLVVKLNNTNLSSIFIDPAPHSVFAWVTNKTVRAEKTLAFIEELKQKYELLVPHMICDAIDFDMADAPVMKRAFVAMVAELKQMPDRVARPDIFYGDRMERAALAFFQNDEDTGADAISLVEIASAKKLCADPSPRLRTASGFHLMKLGKWTEALAAFESVGDHIVAMESKGPWGCGILCPTSPMAMADRCRLHLGIPAPRPDFHRELQTALLESAEGVAIAADGDSVWVADSQNLLQFDSDGNRIQKIAFKAPKPVSVIAVTKENLYFGTEGAGLIQVAKSSLHTVKYHSVESLLSEHITALRQIGGFLWIGYGHQRLDRQNYWSRELIAGRSDFNKDATGLVGTLDLATGKFTGFPFSQAVKAQPIDGQHDYPVHENTSRRFDDLPPNRPILDISGAPDSSVYFAVADRGVQCFEQAQNRWTTLRNNMECPVTAVAVSDEFFCVGQMDGRVANSVNKDKSLWIREARDTSFKFFTVKEGLPHENVTALLLEKDHLWIGGFGFVAELNLRDRKIRRIFSVPGREITKLARAGKNLWISSEDAVYTTHL